MGPEYSEMKAWSAARACTRCARKPAAPTSTSAGRTAKRPSSSAASSARGGATSARSTPGSPPSSDREEPRRVAESVQRWGCVTPPSPVLPATTLPDGGAWLYAETVRQIRALNPGTGVELLIPDFNGKPDLLARGIRRASGSVGAQRRNGAAHLPQHPSQRLAISDSRRADRRARGGLVTKSNLILGMGETPEEIRRRSRICTRRL